MTPPMRFTDEQLSKLREFLKTNYVSRMYRSGFGPDDFRAILARLDAAEYVLAFFLREMPRNIICPCCNSEPHVLMCALDAKLRAWKEITGK